MDITNLSDKEKMREYSRNHYLQNKQKVLARQKQRRSENQDEYRAYARAATAKSRAKFRALNPLAPDPTPHERFLQKIKVTESGCWEWQGVVTPKGYAQMKIQQKQTAMHRWSYLHHKGPIPEGMQIDHTCHSKDARCPGGNACIHRRCVNSDHLEAVDGTTNVRRGRESYWANEDLTRATHCPHGHEYTPENSFLFGKDNKYRMCRTCRRIQDIESKARRRTWRSQK